MGSTKCDPRLTMVTRKVSGLNKSSFDTYSDTGWGGMRRSRMLQYSRISTLSCFKEIGRREWKGGTTGHRQPKAARRVSEANHTSYAEISRRRMAEGHRSSGGRPRRGKDAKQPLSNGAAEHLALDALRNHQTARGGCVEEGYSPWL